MRNAAAGHESVALAVDLAADVEKRATDDAWPGEREGVERAMLSRTLPQSCVGSRILVGAHLAECRTFALDCHPTSLTFSRPGFFGRRKFGDAHAPSAARDIPVGDRFAYRAFPMNSRTRG